MATHLLLEASMHLKGIDGGLTTKEGFPTSVTYGFLKAFWIIAKILVLRVFVLRLIPKTNFQT